jgi:rhodanese-related sulfurtransferase
LVIVDVRTALNQLPLNDRIPGARHIDLSRIESGSVDAWPKETEIVTYCACPNDASAVKAAVLLARRGNSVRVLKGGFDAWVKAGYPLQAI